MADSEVHGAFKESSAAERDLHPAGARSPRLWPWLGLLAVLAALLVWRTLRPPSGEAPGRGQRHAAVGTKLPAVSLEPLTGSGKPVTSAGLAGKVTLINFWATWCVPCKLEFPGLVELQEHFRSQPDFQFLSVSSGSEGPLLEQETVQFLRQLRIDIPTYQDPGAQTQQALVIAAKLNGFALPTTVLLDGTGTIRGLWVGFDTADERSLREAIEKALRGEPLPAATQHPE